MSKKKAKRIIGGFLFIFITAIIVTIFYRINNVKARDASFYTVYYGETTLYENEGYFIYQTRDRVKSSDITYKTIGFEISRIKAGMNPCVPPYNTDQASLSANDPHAYYSSSGTYTKSGQQREKLVINCDETMLANTMNGKYTQVYEAGSNQKYYVCTWEIPVSSVENAISNYSSDWWAEIAQNKANGEPIYLGFDSIMVTVTKDSKGSSVNSGFIQQSAQGEQTMRGSCYDWSNWDNPDKNIGIINKYGWSDKTAFQTHYNKYIVYTSQPDLPPEPDLPDPTEELMYSEIVKNPVSESNTASQASGDASPTVTTYNTSDKYDLGKGIPSSESYTNGISIDTWYGTINTGKCRYKCTGMVKYTGTYQVFAGYKTIANINSDGTVSYVQEPIYFTYKYANYRQKEYLANYYFIASLNLNQFVNANITNDSVGTWGYNIPQDIKYNISINGEICTNGTSFNQDTFDPDTDYHIILNDADNNMNVSQFMGTGANCYITDVGSFNSKAELVKAGEEAADTLLESQTVGSRNDLLQLNATDASEANYVTYMDDIGLHFDNMTQLSSDSYRINDEYNELVSYTNNSVEPEQTVTIPTEKANGKYYTTVSANYVKFANKSGTSNFTLRDTITNKNAIKNSADKNDANKTYLDNEPVVVHSPVIAPISIAGEGQTQVADREDLSYADTPKLLLDGTYTVNFDWKTLFDLKGYDELTGAGLTKFVQGKTVKFPFAVKTNDVYYDVNADGYTDEITIPNEANGDGATSFEIYIPTWAKEGVYGESGYTGAGAVDNPILVRVTANNADALTQLSARNENPEYNETLEQYVATYEYPVQVTGVMYDFQVNSINDEWLFGGLTERNTGIWNFVENSEEKKVGNANRFGIKSLRYTLTGSITSAWSGKNTLPFVNGKSNSSESFNMGYLQRGHSFGFSLKTIANLAGVNDNLNITPTYRYVATDGSVTEQSDLDIYYINSSGLYVKMGSAEDTKKKTSIGSLYNQFAYYDYGDYDPIAQAAADKGVEYFTFMDTETACFSLGNIKMPSSLRLLSGNEEELAANASRSANIAYRYGSGLGTLTDTNKEAFKNSMQTWYGQYSIPDELLVCKKGDFDKYVDAYGYMEDDADIWLEEGYLVLNFDIYSSHATDSTTEHLKYYNGAGGKDMWDVEKGTNVKTVTVKDITQVTIPLRSGDVAIISLETKAGDRYSVSTLYSN